MTDELVGFAQWCVDHAPTSIEARRGEDGWMLRARVGNSFVLWRAVLVAPAAFDEAAAEAMALCLRDPYLCRQVAGRGL
jgi:hypothetical protein